MNKNYVFIVSTMRAGSTLLKALLATRSDVSDIPETHFSNAPEIKSTAPTIVVKKPAYYGDPDYPQLPSMPSKKLVLVRNPHDTILSLQHMNTTVTPARAGLLNNEDYLLQYWIRVYKSIAERLALDARDVMTVKYEDLVANSVAVTGKIFQFVKCADTAGTDRYSKPSGYEWKWGTDDGGRVIHSLQVRKEKRYRENDALLKLIDADEEAQRLLRVYGYG